MVGCETPVAVHDECHVLGYWTAQTYESTHNTYVQSQDALYNAKHYGNVYMKAVWQAKKNAHVCLS